MDPVKRRLEEQGLWMDSPQRLGGDFVDLEARPRSGADVWQQQRVWFVDRSARIVIFLAVED